MQTTVNIQHLSDLQLLMFMTQPIRFMVADIPGFTYIILESKTTINPMTRP